MKGKTLSLSCQSAITGPSMLFPLTVRRLDPGPGSCQGTINALLTGQRTDDDRCLSGSEKGQQCRSETCLNLVSVSKLDIVDCFPLASIA